MSLLDNLKDISTNGINKLKEMKNIHNCGCCNEVVNTNTDEDIIYSDTLNNWFHYDCLNNLDRCNSCDNASYHLEHGICSRCMNSQSIRNYSFRPNPIFHRVNNKQKSVLVSDSGYSKHGLPILHFGVEIEVDIHEEQEEDYGSDIILEGNNFASLVNIIGRGIGKSNLFYSKSDGSLTEQGVEVVSHPFSWNFWKQYGKNIYDALFSALISSGYYSAESSEGGMHIHVSKSAINRTQLHKLLWFIYECPSFIKMIAQRSSRWGSVSWSSLIGGYANESFSKRRAYVSKIAKRKFSPRAERYTAINMQPNDTIEFRMFNGTLNIMTLSKAIEFIHSLLSYCSQTSFRDIVNNKSETVRVEGYLKFLSENQKRYSNLCIFLDKEMSELLSKQKRRKYFGISTEKVGRTLLNMGLNSDRTATSFNYDRKGIIL